MFKKAYSTFFTPLFIFSLLTGCVKSTDSAPTHIPVGVTAPVAEAPDPASTSQAFSAESISTYTLTPSPSASDQIDFESAVAVSPRKRLITPKFFTTISSPELKGRAMGSDGSEHAREIIVDLFMAIGLETYDKDYFMPIFKDPFVNVSYDSDIKGDGINILGLLHGKNSDECLIISAHYDGSKNGSAALDNASGVYCLLRTAEALTEYGKKNKPPRDILFAAFDGEEVGLIGSGSLAEDIKNRYVKAININLDSVGLKGSDSYMVIGDTKLFDVLITSLYQQMELYNFQTVPIDHTYNSDHLPFEWRGIPAASIGERDVTDIVHTANDVSDNVDIPEIGRLSEALFSYILEQSDALFEVFFN